MSRKSRRQGASALWAPLARQLRIDAIRCTTQAGSGHPTSAMSAADLAAVLGLSHWCYDIASPHRPDNDRLILSKGHAAPLLYALLHAATAISDEELLRLRKMDSPLEGHPNPRLPYVDAATGSLGQGLSIGVGAALAGKRLDRLDFTVWVLLGDSEMAEGSVYEALEAAAYYRLDNLVAIIDVNRLGQRGQTELGWDLDAYRRRVEGFGWEAICIDGHDHAAIDGAMAAARAAERPACIIARTVKGKGVSFTEDAEGWHGRAMTAVEAERALAELGGSPRMTFQPERPAARAAPTPAPRARRAARLPSYRPSDRVATRQAYGEALRAIGSARDDVVVLDAEVSNSTHADLFAKACPERFFEMFIAEQLMINAGQGLSIPSPKTVFCSTFAAFLARAADQIRMAAISGASLRLCGSHAGVSIGEDGPSQMGLEDLAAMRAVPGSTVLYPCDATSAAAMVAIMADAEGISYLRTTRGATPVIYGDGEIFRLGGAKILRRSPSDSATVIAAGITVHEALAAHADLAARGVQIRVIDLYSVKPIDTDVVCTAARETGYVVVCEDHRPEGGIGEAVLAALATEGVQAAFTHLAVRGVPCSGTPKELMERFAISAGHIIEAVLAHPHSAQHLVEPDARRG